LVYSIHDSTEVAIQKMIDASQRMLDVNSRVQGEAAKEEGWGINPIMKRHFELEIKTLQNAPRDEGKLRELLKLKEKENEKATHIEDTQRLVTEIEMLKVVLYLVSRKSR
jgi:methyl coenzyme M reductase beta subunit